MFQLELIIFINNDKCIETTLNWCKSIKYQNINFDIFIDDRFSEKIEFEDLDNYTNYTSQYEFNYYNCDMIDYYYHYVVLSRKFDFWSEITVNDNIEYPNIDEIMRMIYSHNIKNIYNILTEKENYRKYYPLLHHITHYKEDLFKDFIQLDDILNHCLLEKNKYETNLFTQNNLLYKLNYKSNNFIDKNFIIQKISYSKILFERYKYISKCIIYDDKHKILKESDIHSEYKINKFFIKQNIGILHLKFPENISYKQDLNIISNSRILKMTNHLSNINKIKTIDTHISKIYLLLDQNYQAIDVKRVKNILLSYTFSQNKIVNCYRSQLNQILAEAIKLNYDNILILDVDIYLHNNFIDEIYNIFNKGNNYLFYILGYYKGVFGYILPKNIFEYILTNLKQSNSTVNSILDDLYMKRKDQIMYNEIVKKKNNINNIQETYFRKEHILNNIFDYIVFINKTNQDLLHINHYLTIHNINADIQNMDSDKRTFYNQCNHKNLDYDEWHYLYILNRVINEVDKKKYRNILILNDLCNIHYNINNILKQFQENNNNWSLLLLDSPSYNESDQSLNYYNPVKMPETTNAFALNNNIYSYVISQNIIPFNTLLKNIYSLDKKKCFIFNPLLLNKSDNKSDHYNYIKNPLVTVIITIDNNTTINNLSKTISSLKACNYKELELIIIDNLNLQINTILCKYKNIKYYNFNNKTNWYRMVLDCIEKTDGIFISFIRSNLSLKTDRFDIQLLPLIQLCKHISTCNINDNNSKGITAIYNRNIISSTNWNIKIINENTLFNHIISIYNSVEHIDKLLYIQN